MCSPIPETPLQPLPGLFTKLIASVSVEKNFNLTSYPFVYSHFVVFLSEVLRICSLFLVFWNFVTMWLACLFVVVAYLAGCFTEPANLTISHHRLFVDVLPRIFSHWPDMEISGLTQYMSHLLSPIIHLLISSSISLLSSICCLSLWATFGLVTCSHLCTLLALLRVFPVESSLVHCDFGSPFIFQSKTYTHWKLPVSPSGHHCGPPLWCQQAASLLSFGWKAPRWQTW